MKRDDAKQIVGLYVLLLGMLACVVPGQAVQAVPTWEPGGVETAIASTAQAAAQQTEQARPVTSTPTSIPTASLTPTPNISVLGTSLVVRDDQSTLFADYKADMQLVIPSGWLALRINEEEYLKAFASDVVQQNPDIMEHLTYTRDISPEVLRLDAIDLHPGHIHEGVLTNLNVIFEEGNVKSLENWEQAERNRYRPLANFKFLSSKYPTLPDGRRVLVIEESYTARGGQQTIYYRGVFFVLTTGTIVLDFYTNFDFKDTTLPEFEQVVNSLSVLSQQ